MLGCRLGSSDMDWGHWQIWWTRK